MVDEDKTLGQQKVKDGGLIKTNEFIWLNSCFIDEYLLATKRIIQSPTKAEQV